MLPQEERDHALAEVAEQGGRDPRRRLRVVPDCARTIWVTFEHPNGPLAGYAWFSNPDVGKQSSRVAIAPNASQIACALAVVQAATEASLPITLAASNSVIVSATSNVGYEIIISGTDPAVVVDSDA